MKKFEVQIRELVSPYRVQDVAPVCSYVGDSYETVRWLQQQIKWLRKEPYMVPKFDGEFPLEGLE